MIDFPGGHGCSSGCVESGCPIAAQKIAEWDADYAGADFDIEDFEGIRFKAIPRPGKYEP